MARRVSTSQRSQQWTFILAGIGAGLSANRILAALREAGIGIGRTLGLQMVRAARAYFEQQSAAAGLDWNNPIPGDFATPWTSKTRTGYGVTVRIAATNNVTGDEIEVYHTTYTNDLITPGEAIQNAIDSYSDPKYADEFTMQYGHVSNVVEYVPAVV